MSRATAKGSPDWWLLRVFLVTYTVAGSIGVTTLYLLVSSHVTMPLPLAAVFAACGVTALVTGFCYQHRRRRR